MANPFDGIPVLNLSDFATNKEAHNYKEPISDVESLDIPACWPYRPMLPMVKRNDPDRKPGAFPTVGIVLEGQVGVVYTGGKLSIFDLISLPQDQQLQLIQERMTKLEFGSWEKMLEDGWECD